MPLLFIAMAMRGGEKKRIQIGKQVKLSRFADNIIPYIENPKDATRKQIEFIN